MVHNYTICRGYNPTEKMIAGTVTNKARAKQLAKVLAAETKNNVSVFCDGDYLGTAEFPVYLRNIDGILTDCVVMNF